MKSNRWETERKKHGKAALYEQGHSLDTKRPFEGVLCGKRRLQLTLWWWDCVTQKAFQLYAESLTLLVANFLTRLIFFTSMYFPIAKWWPNLFWAEILILQEGINPLQSSFKRELIRKVRLHLHKQEISQEQSLKFLSKTRLWLFVWLVHVLIHQDADFATNYHHFPYKVCLCQVLFWTRTFQ